MTEQPTLGTLDAATLTEIRDYLEPTPEPDLHCVRAKVYGSLLLAHADTLTAQLEAARAAVLRLGEDLAALQADLALPQLYVMPAEVADGPVAEALAHPGQPAALPDDLDQYQVPGPTADEAAAFTRTIEGGK